MFIPMASKSTLQDLMKSSKHFLYPAVYGSIFFLKKKKPSDSWRTLVSERQMTLMGEAKFHSILHSIFEALVVERKTGNCHGEQLGPPLLPTASYLQHMHLLSTLLRCNGFAIDSKNYRPLVLSLPNVPAV